MQSGTKNDESSMHHRKRQRRAECAWADLADELVSHIASFLDERSLAKLGCTEHRTRQVCLDDRLWKRLYWRDFGPCLCATTNTPCLVGAARAFLGGDIHDCVSSWVTDPQPWVCEPGRRVPRDDHWRHTPPWEWHDLFGAGFSTCPHHWPPERLGDHRWAYASMLAPEGRFGRFPDVPLRRVGRVHGANAASFGLPLSFSHGKVTYSGDFDDDGRPCGWGTIIVIVDNTTVVCRISGQWSAGRLDGWASMWRYDMTIRSYFQGHYCDGKRHGRGLEIKAGTEVYDGEWQDDRRKGSGVARTSGKLIRYGPASGTAQDDLGVVYRCDGSVAFAGRFAGDEPRHGDLYDASGFLVYTGTVSRKLEIIYSGTVYLADGTTLSIDLSGTRSLATITYPDGDTLHCVFPPCTTANTRRDPVVIRRFAYSPAANADLAGTVLDGPWQILTTRPDTAGDGDSVFGGHFDRHRQPHALDVVVTRLAEDPVDADQRLCATRALCDFVFWPLSDGTAAQDNVRGRFLDHMAAHYGGRWLVCREVANATRW
ncbi:F-box domain containing protein [Pandoravirus neocaledonia]|uniref:F-box domain containing protein n=1 Tax=Pandoravirus neocaledonia TaxID=2107708 RepID=A0A2U7UD67_9VIRU|nr:F-box domain containing protein [Pandoravirus neocaledonia]AVK76376.1 F-box domain containing protein [Pandoravirus neocaledonia]